MDSNGRLERCNDWKTYGQYLLGCIKILSSCCCVCAYSSDRFQLSRARRSRFYQSLCTFLWRNKWQSCSLLHVILLSSRLSDSDNLTVLKCPQSNSLKSCRYPAQSDFCLLQPRICIASCCGAQVVQGTRNDVGLRRGRPNPFKWLNARDCRRLSETVNMEMIKGDTEATAFWKRLLQTNCEIFQANQAMPLFAPWVLRFGRQSVGRGRSRPRVWCFP
jgi:hypothetical protein